MGLFGSSVKKQQRDLAQEFWAAGIIITTAGEGDQQIAEANAALDKRAATVRSLKAGLDDQEYAEAFNKFFWAERSSGYAPFFERGVSPSNPPR